MCAQPPREYLDKLAAEGRDTNIAWRLLRQLPGRRAAGQAWTTHFANALTEKAGFERCAELLQFFYHRAHRVGIDVHMDDGHRIGKP